MTHNEKNQSTETSPDLTEMLKLRDMNLKTVVIIVFLIYKKLSTDMEDLKKKTTQIKLLQTKAIISQIKNTLNRINVRLDIAEEKISETKERAIRTTKKNRKEGKQWK